MTISVSSKRLSISFVFDSTDSVRLRLLKVKSRSEMSDKEGEAEASGTTKRPHDEEQNTSESEEEEWIGPLPTEAAPAKKRKGMFAVNGMWTIHSNVIFRFILNSSRARETLFGEFTRRRML